MKVSEIENKWRGFTIVRGLTILADPPSWSYDLIVDLSRGSDSSSGSIRVTFRSVSQLKLSDFGGGITQFMHLAVKDVSQRQFENIKFEVTESENGNILLSCKGIEVSSGSLP